MDEWCNWSTILWGWSLKGQSYIFIVIVNSHTIIDNALVPGVYLIVRHT